MRKNIPHGKILTARGWALKKYRRAWSQILDGNQNCLDDDAIGDRLFHEQTC